MVDIIRRTGGIVRAWLRDRCYRFRTRLAQWRRAWRYATNRLSADEARRWAIGLAKDYAADEGIRFVPLEDGREPAT